MENMRVDQQAIEEDRQIWASRSPATRADMAAELPEWASSMMLDDEEQESYERDQATATAKAFQALPGRDWLELQGEGATTTGSGGAATRRELAPAAAPLPLAEQVLEVRVGGRALGADRRKLAGAEIPSLRSPPKTRGQRPRGRRGGRGGPPPGGTLPAGGPCRWGGPRAAALPPEGSQRLRRKSTARRLLDRPPSSAPAVGASYSAARPSLSFEEAGRLVRRVVLTRNPAERHP